MEARLILAWQSVSMRPGSPELSGTAGSSRMKKWSGGLLCSDVSQRKYLMLFKKEKQLTALMKFSRSGELKNILINCANDEEEKLIKRTLSKLFRPNLLSQISRCFNKEIW